MIEVTTSKTPKKKEMHFSDEAAFQASPYLRNSRKQDMRVESKKEQSKDKIRSPTPSIKLLLLSRESFATPVVSHFTAIVGSSELG